jgi:hypothetical protein
MPDALGAARVRRTRPSPTRRESPGRSPNARDAGRRIGARGSMGKPSGARTCADGRSTTVNSPMDANWRPFTGHLLPRRSDPSKRRGPSTRLDPSPAADDPPAGPHGGTARATRSTPKFGAVPFANQGAEPGAHTRRRRARSEQASGASAAPRATHAAQRLPSTASIQHIPPRDRREVSPTSRHHFSSRPTRRPRARRLRQRRAPPPPTCPPRPPRPPTPTAAEEAPLRGASERQRVGSVDRARAPRRRARSCCKSRHRSRRVSSLS